MDKGVIKNKSKKDLVLKFRLIPKLYTHTLQPKSSFRSDSALENFRNSQLWRMDLSLVKNLFKTIILYSTFLFLKKLFVIRIAMAYMIKNIPYYQKY